jgi:hypothetical protein
MGSMDELTESLNGNAVNCFGTTAYQSLFPDHQLALHMGRRVSKGGAFSNT